MSTQTSFPVELSGRLAAKGDAVFSGIHAEILLGGEAAPMTVMELTVEPETGAPAHISFDEDKVFHVSAGHLIFLIGEDKIAVETGAHVFVGRGVVHGFTTVEGMHARMTLVSTPARHDRFFQAMGELPQPHQMADVQKVCERFGQAIVGPIVQP